MKRSEAIKRLLESKTHPDLATLYNKDMEVQFNVAQDGGERVDQDYKGRIFHSYTDGIDKWSHFRIPKNAKTDPIDNDSDVYTDLYTHAEGVGLTGWDWKNRLSRWVAFDFDAMTGHSDKHEKKLTDIELQELKTIVSSIPWVTIRLSTSGKGIHLYVFLEPVETNNHTEHAALARAVLGLMVSITGFDFKSKVDQCGGNMWIWHRKMVGTKGLTLLKQGEVLKDIPLNWRDHVRVVSGSAKKTLPEFITTNAESNPNLQSMFEEITGTKTCIPLDAEHQRLIKFLHDNKACAWWDQDHHMLVTHTIHLLEAHEKLGLKGIFKTNAKGENYGNDHNVYAYPMRNGAWVVRRYTPGVAEESTWGQDNQGWTRCYFNRNLDFSTACRAFEGVEDSSGTYFFREAEVASKAANLLGIDLNVPHWTSSRQTTIASKKGRYIVKIDSTVSDDPSCMRGWAKKKGHWEKVFNGRSEAVSDSDIGNYDEVCRHILSSGNSDMGWMIKTERDWREEPLVHLTKYLMGCKFDPNKINEIIGAAIAKPWRLVCRPFEDEYPKTTSGRDWNLKAPQLRFKPTAEDNLNYPTWLKILNHCGKSLDEPIKKNAWAKNAGILTGADYLKVWLASMFQEPLQPLPYLFFYGPQDSGKSIFHEAIRDCLVTSGVVRVDSALTNPSGFNAELEHAILCVVEETSMKKNAVAYNRLKDWVTTGMLAIHPKGRTPYSVINTGHYVQTSNEYDACPVMTGDSRITMMYVGEIPLRDKVPKKIFLQLLEKEAPDFIAELFRIQLPDSNDRLNVPIIVTEEKIRAQQATQDYLELFIEDMCFYAPGESILYSKFFDVFQEWLPANEVQNWPKIQVGRRLPDKYPKGRSITTNQVMVGNISFEAIENKHQKALIVRNDKLVPQE